MPGLLYGVVDRECARQCYTADLTPDGRKTNRISGELKIIEIMNVNGDKVSQKIVIDTYITNEYLNAATYRHKYIIITAIKYSQIVTGPSNTFIWIILAKVQQPPAAK